MRPTSPQIRPRGGFTLIELLVVITIIALISAAALPVVLPALNERRVSEAARLIQATLAGTRDAAIRANAPRGIRLLPDPLYSFASNFAGQPLAANRIVPIELAPDYSEGTVNGYVLNPATPTTPVSNFTPNDGSGNPLYVSAGGLPATYLRVQSNEATTRIFTDTTQNPPVPTPVYVPETPTGWLYNIRQGDKIRFNDSGAYYTIAGPIHGTSVLNNPERYICYRAIGDESSISLFGDPASQLYGGKLPLEYLNLTNGIDDDGDGWVDESCDGIDNDGDGIIDPGFNGIDDDNMNGIDDPAEMFFFYDKTTNTLNRTAGTEYEAEVFLGALSGTPPSDLDYTIVRRPVVSPNAAEITLPAGTVIDLTTWNSPASQRADATLSFLPERSRLPVDPFSGYVDIMIDQSGRVVPPGAGGSSSLLAANSPIASLPFYHFWVSEREGVVAPLFGSQSQTLAPGAGTTQTNTQTYVVPSPNPNYNASPPQTYLLPMPKGTLDVNGNAYGGPFLSGERRLVTLFTKTGQIVSNSIDVSKFSVNDTSAPYYDAQSGTKEPL